MDSSAVMKKNGKGLAFMANSFFYQNENLSVKAQLSTAIKTTPIRIAGFERCGTTSRQIPISTNASSVTKRWGWCVFLYCLKRIKKNTIATNNCKIWFIVNSFTIQIRPSHGCAQTSFYVLWMRDVCLKHKRNPASIYLATQSILYWATKRLFTLIG